MKTMEYAIEKIVELAKEYADVAIQAGYPQGWNDFRKGVDFSQTGRISVYLYDNNETKSILFDYIEIMLYSEKISFPYYYTLKKLSDIYDSAKNFLIYFRKNEMEKTIKSSMKLKEEKIKMLENEIKQLKGIQS